MRNFIILSAVGAALSACGGGGDAVAVAVGSGAITDDGGVNYPTLALQTSDVSTIGGTRVGNNGDVANLTGDYTHSTGATRFSDGTVTLNSSVGNQLTGLDDGTTQVSVFAGAGLTTQMQFLTPVTITAPNGNGSAIIGLVTDPSDIPGSASATYVGQSSVNVASGGGAFEMTGSATTVADFASDDVDVTLGNFSSSSSPAPFDTLRITNMTISGAGFSGGTLRTTLNGRSVDVLGSSATFASRGGFFGLDSENNIPAEVGGGFRGDGSGGELISGIYTGD